jgi:hypothetical protein
MEYLQMYTSRYCVMTSLVQKFKRLREKQIENKRDVDT